MRRKAIIFIIISGIFSNCFGGEVNEPNKPAEAGKTSAVFIITFEPTGGFKPLTARELLKAFNEKHPKGVRTHHYRTQVQDKKLVGLICVDGAAGRDAIAAMLKASDKLALVDIKEATEELFSEYVKLGQPDLEIDPNMVPVIVRTNPKAFVTDVSPNLKEIMVAFDKPMLDNSWSWTGSGETYPETAGQPHYDANITVCTLPVKLAAGRVYWVGINSPRYKNFKSADGVPASWYIILFATKSADGKPTSIPGELLTKAKNINEIAMKKSAPPVRSGGGLSLEPLERNAKPDNETKVLSPVGTWKTVDFVPAVEMFEPGRRSWTGRFHLEYLSFLPDGLTSGVWLWEKNYMWQPHKAYYSRFGWPRYSNNWQPHTSEPKMQFVIEEIDGMNYMFLEWISGDVIKRGQKPWYYVFKKVSDFPTARKP